MKRFAMVLVIALLAPSLRAVETSADDALTQHVKAVADAATKQFAEQKLKAEEFAITVIDLRDPAKLKSGSYRGGEGIYPASVVKLFYLAAAHQWMEDGKVEDSDELRRGLSDMIVKSTNDATNWVVEAITDAGNGPLLPDDQWKQWQEKRNSINRYFEGLGYRGINVCQKTFIEGPYGRDKLFLGSGFTNRNKLTTDATARLMAEIALGQSVTPDRSKQMMKLLQRDPTAKPRGNDDQNIGFSAIAIPKDAKLWSKAGWTTTARHDAAYIEMADGLKLVIVIFTTGHGGQREILPAIVGKICTGMPRT